MKSTIVKSLSRSVFVAVVLGLVSQGTAADRTAAETSDQAVYVLAQATEAPESETAEGESSETAEGETAEGEAAEGEASEGEAAEAEAAEGEAAAGDADFETLMTEGARVFANNCAVCHGAEGDEALSSHVEILAGNDRAVRVANRVVRRVMHGGTYMPAFGDALSDREIQAVVTFVRNSWGNDHGPVTIEEVTEWR